MDALRDQRAVELAGDLRDAICGEPVPEEVAGHADLAAVAAAAAQHRLPELGPDLNELRTPSIAYACASGPRGGYRLGGPITAKEARRARAMDKVSETCVRF